LKKIFLDPEASLEVLNLNENKESVDISTVSGLKMIPIEAGNFVMGCDTGDYDEVPVHKVNIKKPFYISAEPVTFRQYEELHPGFRDSLMKVMRLNYDKEVKSIPEYDSIYKDTDPVVGITWHDAVEFCDWLNKKEGRPLTNHLIYRLPTEAEWEYAAQFDSTVLGLKKILGIEQWTMDWYGPYIDKDQSNPAGYSDGTSKVTRGGSEWTFKESMRPSNRMSFLPEDRFAKLSFRVVLGEPSFSYIKEQPIPNCEKNVSQTKYNWKEHNSTADKVIFIPPIPFVKIPEGSMGPLFSEHNHFPSITWCPNGDLLATWYTDLGESSTQLNIAASRMRCDNDEWDPPSLFWSLADRNDHSSAIWTDTTTGQLYHFQGIGSFPHQVNQALAMRTSNDNGATWTYPEIINTVRSMWNPHVVMRTREGTLIVTSDLNWIRPIIGRIILSHDNGKTWHAPKGHIIGQHPGIVQLKDGSIMAVGRDNWFPNSLCPGFGLPISESKDWGETWSYRREPSLSGGIDGSQRPVLIRLREGPILYIGFTNQKYAKPPQGIMITDENGNQHMVYGMFSALSFDEGKTWEYHKLITPGPEKKEYNGGGNTRIFTTDATHAEPLGYLQATQSPDGIIHLISSRLHYRFNLAWLKTPTVTE